NRVGHLPLHCLISRRPALFRARRIGRLGICIHAAAGAGRMTQVQAITGPAAPVAYLVDDNEPFRRSTSLLLETAFIDVRDFDSGAALLAQLEREPAPRTGACVVSDIRMPHMSGLVLMEELRRREQSMRVIFVTA